MTADFRDNGRKVRPLNVVLIYQRMLPYHLTRFNAIADRLQSEGKRCLALEVASTDSSYGQLDDEGNRSSNNGRIDQKIICLFPSKDYLDLAPKQVADVVEQALLKIRPSVVFAPAPAFAEGAGALHYKVRYGGKLILMDDAWAGTDQRGWLTRQVKRAFYAYVDGGFFPSEMHGDYFAGLNVPLERQAYSLDSVGNAVDGYSNVWEGDARFLLFVGRLIERKGLPTLLRALASLGGDAPELVVIGDGPQRQHLEDLARDLGLGAQVHWVGRKSNTETRRAIAAAEALLVPSDFEQWGLVVNEAWMAGTLVLGSNTIGALRATATLGSSWMMVPVGNVPAWRSALTRLLELPDEERTKLVVEGRKLADQFSLQKHVESASKLMRLPPRSRPFPAIGWLACRWTGKVAVW